MHYPDLNPLCLFKLHDNYPETGGLGQRSWRALLELIGEAIILVRVAGSRISVQ